MERVTIQRKLILESIKEIGHATTKDIVAYLNNKGFNFSLATIYRNLDSLVSDNLLRRVSIDFKENYYEVTSISPHDHFVCNECGKIYDVQKQNNDLKEVSGNKIAFQTTTYYGVCKNCLNK